MMENTFFFEDIEYSVTSDPNGYNPFVDNFKQQYQCEIDQLIIEGRIIKVEEKPINEKRGWHYFGKNKFEVIKTELNEFYRIIEPERLRLNPHLIDQIKFDAERKKAEIENLQNDYLNKENNAKTFAENHWEYSDVESWLYVINKIVEQPLYIIEAIEKYPESIEENQLIYFRHDYIKSRIGFASDKHIIRTFDINRLIYSKLVKEINIKSLFYFFEQLIEVLQIYSEIDYIKTQLFKLLFDEFYVFYERGVTEFNLHEFKNIETVKKQLNELNTGTPQTKKIFNSLKVKELKILTDTPVNIDILIKKINFKYKEEFKIIIGELNESKVNPQKAKGKEFTAVASILYHTGWITKNTTFADCLRTFSMAYNRSMPTYKETQVKECIDAVKRKAPFLDKLPFVDKPPTK